MNIQLGSRGNTKISNESLTRKKVMASWLMCSAKKDILIIFLSKPACTKDVHWPRLFTTPCLHPLYVQQLQHKYQVVGMDNLYMSTKLCKGAFTGKNKVKVMGGYSQKMTWASTMHYLRRNQESKGSGGCTEHSEGSSAQRRSRLSQCGSLFCLWHKTSACSLYCLYQP